MSVTDHGAQPDDLLHAIEAGVTLIDQAAQAHAEAIVSKAQELGYVHHTDRTIERPADGVRVITDHGIPMAWLLGRRVPLRGVTDANGKPAIRTVSAASLARGGWKYPGRRDLLEEAAASPEVQAVVDEWTRRLAEGR